MFLKAAEQGHAEAAYQIGMMSAYGQGVKRDPSVAVKWLERAAEGGFQQAMVDYANMSFEGQVIPKDLEKAAHWFTVAANRCNGYAQYALACMYGKILLRTGDKMASNGSGRAGLGEVNRVLSRMLLLRGRGWRGLRGRCSVRRRAIGTPSKAFLGSCSHRLRCRTGSGGTQEMRSSPGLLRGPFYLGRLSTGQVRCRTSFVAEVPSLPRSRVRDAMASQRSDGRASEGPFYVMPTR